MKRFSVSVVIFTICVLLASGCVTAPHYPHLSGEPPESKITGPINVVLVLGSGGSKGMAHAGVLKVLEDENIPIDLIIGSSAGSIVGAMYADNQSAQVIKNKLVKLRKKDIMDVSVSNSLYSMWGVSGVLAGQSLRHYLDKQISAVSFSELQIPLIVVTTDLVNGERFEISSGQLTPAILASSAVPLVFPPVDIYNRQLVDGGVVSPLPTEVARRFNPKLIIAVDIGESPQKGAALSTAQVIYKSSSVAYNTISEWQRQGADVLIQPDLNEFGMFSDHDNEAVYQLGFKSAQEQLPKIKAALKALNIQN